MTDLERVHATGGQWNDFSAQAQDGENSTPPSVEAVFLKSMRSSQTVPVSREEMQQMREDGVEPGQALQAIANIKEMSR